MDGEISNATGHSVGFGGSSASLQSVANVAFDPAFYVATYPDIDPNLIDPLQHFKEHGKAERRFATRSKLAEAVEVVRASGRFDGTWYRKTYGGGIEDYLLREHSAGVAPNATFNRQFFKTYYHHLMGADDLPFVAYCRNSERPWCQDRIESFQAAADIIRDSPYFDDAYFREACGDLDHKTDSAIYYLTEGFRRGINPSKRFNTRSYVRYHSDVADADANPLLHFIEYGAAERRIAFGVDDVRIVRGSIPRRPARPTILVLSHEGSLSGAPIVALNLVRALGESYTVVCALLRPGHLTEEFAKASYELAVIGDSVAHMMNALDVLKRRHDICCAVLNSVECTKILPALIEHGIPSVSLLHEFAQYVDPFNQFARSLALSDIAVFPSKLVESHARRELRDHGMPYRELLNVKIRPQGRSLVPFVKIKNAVDPSRTLRSLEKLIARRSRDKRPFVVLGAGLVQVRKGADLFIEIARLLIKDMRADALFIWVGHNYRPRTDTSISIYLADQITKSGLDDHIVFFDEQPSLAPFYKSADAFLLSSRLDPFPNVAIEAIAEGKHLVCFEGATGIADLACWPDAVTAVPYGDLRAAAAKLADLADLERPNQPKPELPRGLRDMLSFADYARDIGEAIEDARRRFKAREVLERSLLASDDFDAKLLSRSLPSWCFYDDVQTTSREILSKFAGILAANAMPIGLTRLGRSTTMTATSPDWSAANISTVDPNVLPPTNDFHHHGQIFFIENREDVALIADLVFATPSLKSLIIISETLGPDDLSVVEHVCDSVALQLVDPNVRGSVENAVEVLLRSAGPNSMIGIVFAMSLQQAYANSRSAFPCVFDAASQADVYLLSSLLFAPDQAFVTNERARSLLPEDAPDIVLAHRLVDCRGLWWRPTDTSAKAMTRMLCTLATKGATLNSFDVWDALADESGILANGRGAYICSSSDPQILMQ